MRKIGLDIIQMLNPHRHANHVRRHPTPFLLGLGELLVRGGGRVDDQGLGVPDVGQVRGENAAVDKGDASCICGYVRVGVRYVSVFWRVFFSVDTMGGNLHPLVLVQKHAETRVHAPILFLTFPSALHPKAQHGTKQARPEILLRAFVRLVLGEPWVADPRHAEGGY